MDDSAPQLRLGGAVGSWGCGLRARGLGLESIDLLELLLLLGVLLLAEAVAEA